MDETAVRQETLVRTAETLGNVSQEIAGWVPVLRRLAEAEVLRNLATGHSSEITGAAVRSIIAGRRLREEYFWPSMTEEAWTVMLELFANRLLGQPLRLAGLSSSAEIPLANTVHWVEWLAGRGIVSCNLEAKDEKACHVDLTDAGADQMRAYLAAALKLSPWAQ